MNHRTVAMYTSGLLGILAASTGATANFRLSPVNPKALVVPGESKKYTCLMSHNTASIAPILQIRLGLDSQDFKFDYDIIKVHFTSLLIKLLTHKPTASF